MKKNYLTATKKSNQRLRFRHLLFVFLFLGFVLSFNNSYAQDKDGDGVLDINDLDDDNDGIFDTIEEGGILNLDTDNDGIPNRFDLDSDNDGIMDVIEAGGTDTNGDGIIDGFTDVDNNGVHDVLENTELYVQGNAASTFTEGNNIGSWGLPPEVDINSVSAGSLNGNYLLEIIAMQDGSFDKGVYDFSAIIGRSYDIVFYAKRGVQGTTQRIFNWEGVVSSPDVDILTQTWTRYAFTVVANASLMKIKIYAAGSGGSIGDIVYVDAFSIRETQTQVLPNNDTDTLVNYLDLDSDNDGIPDNIEAQSTLGYIAPAGAVDANGVDTAYTTGLSPINTDGDTTPILPDYIDTDSDNEGGSDTIEAGLTLSGAVGSNGLDNTYDNGDDYTDVNGSFDNTQADNFPDTDNDLNYGGEVDYRDNFADPDTDGDGIPNAVDLDDDNDGIFDTIEEGGILNLDTDNDGIPNRFDLDSDNDGIMDVIEAGGTDTNGDGIIDGFTDVDNNGVHDVLENTELYVQGNAASTFTEGNNIGSWGLPPEVDINSVSAGSLNGNYSLEIIAMQDGSFDKGVYDFSAIIGRSYDIVFYAKRGVQGTTQRIFNWEGVVSSPDVDILTQTWTRYAFTVVANASLMKIKIYAAGSGGSIGDIVYVDAFSIRETQTQVLPNNDTDTLVNYLDLDSDNDGIPDNIEAQSTLGYIAPAGAVDANGVDTAYTTGLSPINTDGDTTPILPDYIDTDSDNEGGSDTIEAGLTLSGAVGSNGLDNTYDNGDDYTDVNGSFDNTQADNFPDTDNDLNYGGEVDYRDNFADPDTDGDGIPNVGDLDDDNDGISDIAESGGQDPSIDGDNDNVPFYLDDNDGDSTIGNVNGVIESGFDFDGDGIPNHLDLDSDADGISDIIEAGGTDVDNDGHVDYPTAGDPSTLNDGNNNGLDDTIEATPLPLPNTDTTFGANFLDIDADDDGIVDNIEGQTTVGYIAPAATDSDNDGLNDAYDGDNELIVGIGGGTGTAIVPTITGGSAPADYINTNTDADGDLDSLEAYDTDNDGVANILPANADDDGDGLDNNYDANDALLDPTNGGQTPLSFPDLDNPGGDRDWRQALDSDNDGVADITDLDDDNDGIPDTTEGVGIDTDNDGVINSLDVDSDNDGIFDVTEAGQNALDGNNDGVIDTLGSVGSNGLFDALETFPDSGIRNLTNFPIVDSETVPDGVFDFLELDADNDNCFDVVEAGFTDGDSPQDGLLGTSPVAVDGQGRVTSGIDGYTLPADGNTNSVFDFQEANTTATITTQPNSSETILVGGTVSYTVTVSSGDTFRWEESTSSIAGPYTTITNGGVYSGQGTATLTITGAPLLMNGNYYRVVVSVSNFACDAPVTSNPASLLIVQLDSDNDGIADVNDLDDDNDGIPDVDENAGGVAADLDGDTIPNRLDLDSDNDGIFDLVESGQLNGTTIVDLGNDGVIDGANNAGVGANGLFNLLETAVDSGTLNTATRDSDSDTIVDSNELDADNDTCFDLVEAGFGAEDLDTNGRLGSDPGLTVDANGKVNTPGLTLGYTTPNDLDTNSVFDFQEVGTAAAITTQPVAVTIIAGNTATFTVAGNATVYTWQVNTGAGWVNVDDTPANITITTTVPGTSTLEITNTPIPGFNGNLYRVILSTPAFVCDSDVTSAEVLLTVLNDNDGDGVADINDIDDDNDGVTDIAEGGDILDTDGDGDPNRFDLDADGDGIWDTNESGITTDLDPDNDGVIDLANNATVGTNGLYDPLESPADSGTLNYTVLNTDGDAAINVLDIDDDGDMILTQYEHADNDANGDPSDARNTDLNFAGGDAIPDYLDADDDGDGINTQYEGVNPDGDRNPSTGATQNSDASNAVGSDAILDYLDPDDDGDTVGTFYEGVNADADGNPNTGTVQNTDNGLFNGDTLPDYLDQDDDGDGLLTNFESPNPDNDVQMNPSDALNTDGTNTVNADAIPNYLDNDDDGDGLLTFYEDADDNNDGNPNDAVDTDSNSVPDYLDQDDDGDTVLTYYEGADPNMDGNPADAQNTDAGFMPNGDSLPDYRDPDDDGDTVNTVDENPADANGNPVGAQNTDGDTVNDYLDIDDDNDGILTHIEDNATNSDSDSRPNYLDLDSDGDGIPDNVEVQPTVGYKEPTADTDGNGLSDAYESAPGAGGAGTGILTPENTTVGSDPDYKNPDSDGDGVPDFVEGHDYSDASNLQGHPDGNPDVAASGNDNDNDGLDDAYDSDTNSYADPNGNKVTNSPLTELPNRDRFLVTTFGNNITTEDGVPLIADDLVDYRDTDDDGDGRLTSSTGIDGEDSDSDGNPRNDNCNGPPDNNIPNYLDPVGCNFVPDGFSPNGDGMNEEFIIPALAEFKNFSMEVYDRWGNAVYEYNNNGKADPDWWNGYSTGSRTLSKGDLVPAGTYFYVIKFNEAGRAPRTGWVYVNY